MNEWKFILVIHKQKLSVPLRKDSYYKQKRVWAEAMILF